ncbi:Cytochrome P450 [Nannocystis exedens]|uniref:Cytochrome P450 n=1 Tax=Nannocystis exedens TaxID=54 RepID=A0A1I1VEA0_9BACT|nr:cytochrome P450 [Nannocystis exedens]PCC72453.1 Cytochrome P450 107B1 [Nannocystis exedens]SFD79423.1 Cytochrome P450 [Nannocystis exedens]
MTASSEVRPFLDLHGSDFSRDPHAVLRAAREQSWCADTALGPAILRYREVQATLAQRTLRTPGPDFLAMQGIHDGPLVEIMSGFLLNTEGPAHDRLRRLISRSFTVRRVEAVRPRIVAIAEELTDALVVKDRCDLVAEFADPFARRVLCAFVGIPADAQARVRRWTADLGLLFGLSVAAHRAQIEASMLELRAFIDDLIALRRRDPLDDLLSELVAAETNGDALTDLELRAMIVTFMSAGSDTVLNQLGHAFAAFLAHPEQWRLLAADPSLAAAAAEEVVRYSPASLLGVPRIATADVEVAGHVFPRGSFLLPITGSANRDAQVFADPDRFDITRKRDVHLTFGGGIHYCLGAALARVQLQITLPMLAARLGELHPDGPIPWLPPTEAVYGPLSVPVGYRARA